jgi:hypothetical protein
MTLRRLKLVADAKEKARELGIAVGFLQDDNRHQMEVDDDNVVVADSRDYHLLHHHGLVEEAELASPVAAETDEAPKSTGIVGGVGHQPNDGYGNDRIQAEIKRDQERGEAQKKEAGTPSVKDSELDENLRHEGRLPKERGKKPEVKAAKEQDKAGAVRDKDRS